MRFAHLGPARIENDVVLTAIEQPRHHRRTHFTDAKETDSCHVMTPNGIHAADPA